jgi:hypothetical protein
VFIHVEKIASKTDRDEMFSRSHSMEQIPFSASKEIPEFLGTQRLVFIFTRALVPMQSQTNADGITSFY